MRIEKISENQIRCFLSKEDLEIRQVHLKELAYGTRKAKILVHELMLKAWHQYGFSAENMPVMVEAVPMFDESLVLNITRVENPEELDTRFSSFAPSVRSGAADAKEPGSSPLDQLMESIRQDPGTGQSGAPCKRSAAGRGAGSGSDGVPQRSSGPQKAGGPGREQAAGMQPQLFTFRSLFDASSAAAAAAGYPGTSSLYRDSADAKYYLFLDPVDGPETETAAPGRWFTAFSEFGSSEYITPAREQHLREHCEVLCSGDAVEQLARLGQK